MPFIDQVQGVYPDAEVECLQEYLVGDCVQGGDIQVVLLCESPHTAELAADPHLPLLGRSGESVTRALRHHVLQVGIDEDQAIGELVCEEADEFAWLGLMNACPLPMQRTAYPNPIRHALGDLLGDLEAIRVRKNLTPVQQQLADEIAADLAGRWHDVAGDEEPLLIPCGDTARRLRAMAALPAEDALPNTPHPSRNQWGMALALLRTMERIRDRLAPRGGCC